MAIQRGKVLGKIKAVQIRKTVECLPQDQESFQQLENGKRVNGREVNSPNQEMKPLLLLK